MANGNVITEKLLEKYRAYLADEEKSIATATKYIRDIRKFKEYAGGCSITKEIVAGYKEDLRVNKKYKLSSINSFLIAINSFFSYMGWYGLRVKTYKVQKELFAPAGKDLSKQDYKKLVYAARRKGKKRLAMVIQTICATGMRVSELSSVTANSVRKGVVDIYCKGKHRQVLLPGKLRKLLLVYISGNKIKGIVFCTSSGKAVDRSNIWREMKELGDEAGVALEKIFPHNLRHLFAKVFYETNKDIARLADVLGHSSIETTRLYIMVTCVEHQRQLDIMELV
jgi:site-specific recombinase XerD